MDGAWEYRVWLNAGGNITDEIRRQARTERGEYRTDVYLLARDRDDLNVKLRGETQFEVKVRRRQEGSFEYWERPVSHPFPLTDQDLEVGGLQAMKGHAETAHALLAMAQVSPRIAVCTVRKHRQIYTYGQTQVEITEIIGEGLPPLTVGIEAPTEREAREAANLFGFAGHDNVGYRAKLLADD